MFEIVIVGASGFGLELQQYLQDAQADSGAFRFKGFLDDDPDKQTTGSPNPSAGDPPNITVIGDTRNYPIEENDRFLIGVGHPATRARLADRLQVRGARFFRLIHPLAYVADSAEIGAGCIIAPFASVGAHAVVGKNSLINLYAAVGHDCRIGDHSVFSPYAVANGRAKVGSSVFLGSHAVVTPMAEVGDHCKIAAASVVYHPVPDASMAAGNPAQATSLKNTLTSPSQRKLANA